MLYLVIFILLAVLLTALAFMIKMKIVMKYTRIGEDDNAAVSLFLPGGLMKLKLEIPLADIDSEGLKIRRVFEKGRKEKDFSKGKGVFGFSDIYQKIVKMNEFYHENCAIINKVKCYILNKLVLKEFTLDVRVGAGDAFYTGIILGGVWTVAGMLASYLSNSFRTYRNCVNIRPNFSEKELVIDFFCIFETKIAHIIVVLIMLLMHFRTFRQNVKRKMIGGDLVG